MLGWFQALMPKEARFFDFFDAHARILNEAAAALNALLNDETSIASNSAKIIELEDKADDVTREVLLAVRRTFITPFDRGDIQSLIGSMDDAIDQMHQTVKAIDLFEVKSFEPGMKEMGRIIVDSAQLTAEAVNSLRQMNKHAAELHDIAMRLTRLEEKSDQLHDAGLKGLFKASATGNPMSYIAGSEIYAHLEKVVDRFEDVAGRVDAIVIEHI